MSSVNDTSRRGLGRGLEVLIGGAGEAELLHLPVEAVHPNPRQPRRRFEPEATSGLAASIRHQGVLQPVVVRPRPEGGYELIAGERRWRAAREAGVPTIPAVVRNADDRDTLLLGLVENVARENLSPVEEARAYASLIDEFELSLGEVAERVGRSKPSVSNRVRLLELPGGRARGCSPAATSPRATPGQCWRCRTTTRAGAWRGRSPRTGSRSARRRRRPATAAPAAIAQRGAVDPALAERARVAAHGLTGLPAKVNGGKLELEFADETGLAELVEVLEALL